MIINRQSLDDLFVGYSAAFNQGFGMAGDDWQKVAMPVASSTAENHYAWLGSIKGMNLWLGDRIISSMASHDYRIKNKLWEDSVSVNRTDIEDDQVGVYTPLFTEMGRSLMAHKNELVFGLLKKGFKSPCYDGQYFFDTDHPVENKDGSTTTASNSGGGSGSPWFLLDTSRMIKPIIFQERKKGLLVRKDRSEDDNVFMRNVYLYGVECRDNVGFGLWQLAYGSKQSLTTDNYKAAFAALESMKNRGRPLGVKPTMLVVPPAHREAALEILNAERNMAGATNVWRGTAELLVSSWLA